MKKFKELKKFKPRLSQFELLPTDVYMKAKEMPVLSKVCKHKHDWDQLIYAIKGVLEVRCDNELNSSCNTSTYIIPPQQAVWIPANFEHSITTITGAQLRSVHVKTGLVDSFKDEISVLKVDNLVKELIFKASTIEFGPQMSEVNKRLLMVLVDQICNLPQVDLCLPFSNDPLLMPILSWLQTEPACKKTLLEWSFELGASSKTVSRRFDSQLGMSFIQWRELLKVHKAIVWLNENRSVTHIALDLGYDSLPAFIQMFKRNMGVTPGKFCEN